MSIASKRASSAAGIVFVALFVIGTFMSLDTPDVSNLSSGVADQKTLHYLSTSSHRIEHVIGAYLLIVGGVLFVWFCLGLRARLEMAAPGNQTAGRLIALLAAVGAVLMTMAGMTSAVVAGAVSAGSEPLPANGSAARVVMDMTFPLLCVAFALMAAALIATVCVVGRGAGVLPSWLIYTGWLAVLGCIFGIIFLPMVLPMLWFLAVAIAGVASAGTASTGAAPATG